MNENKAPLAEKLIERAQAEIVIYKGQAVLKGIRIDGMPIETYIKKTNLK